MPALSHHFGLHPPGVYDLTVEELEPYLDALNEIQQEQAR